MSEEQVDECLAEAGCGRELIEQFKAGRISGRPKMQMRLLADYRRLLMNRIHANQKKLDLLDYLIWNMKTGDSSQREGKP